MLRYHKVLITVSSGYPFVQGRLPTRYSPVRRFPLNPSSEEFFMNFSLDLHVLGTPPAFILSQDQTLEINGISLAFLRFRVCDPVIPSPACGRFVSAKARGYLTHSKRVALELLCFCIWELYLVPSQIFLDNSCDEQFCTFTKPLHYVVFNVLAGSCESACLY